ncbi:MAG: hemin uptake protein HemP [Planctomycetaceae bacterium]|nr:hemin uptake protein HemP [Planctomycetaceae bacterium]
MSKESQRCPGDALHESREPRGPGGLDRWAGTMRVVRSEELLQGGREVLILHEGQIYRLSHTRSGKLILHK